MKQNLKWKNKDEIKINKKCSIKGNFLSKENFLEIF